MSIYNLHRTCPGYDYNLCIALLPGAPQVELVMADLFISWLIVAEEDAPLLQVGLGHCSSSSSSSWLEEGQLP